MAITNKRIEKLLAALPADVDAIIVTNGRNQLYLCNFAFDDGYLFITRNQSYILTDSRYDEAAQEHADKAFKVLRMWKRGEMFAQLCKENNVSKVSFEDSWLTVSAYESLKAQFAPVPLVCSGKLIEGIREHKDDCEIENIISAQRIAEKAFDHILGYITPERTETEVALELEFTMRHLGASGLSFPTIAVSGSASSLPHGEPRNQKLEKGFFTMDFGCVFNGYCSDMTRTVIIGKADEEMKKLYNTVLLAQESAEAAIHDGVTGAELDKIARDIIDKDYPGKFGHSLGHGVGMYIHEAPGVSGGNLQPITVGHVITIEPGIYIPGKYGCRIEDMAVIRSSGAEVITHCPKYLIEI